MCVYNLYTGSGATVLQKAEVRIINSTVCDTLMKGQITSRMTCAGVLAGGVDACQVWVFFPPFFFLWFYLLLVI